jgi:hypothetical protein
MYFGEENTVYGNSAGPGRGCLPDTAASGLFARSLTCLNPPREEPLIASVMDEGVGVQMSLDLFEECPVMFPSQLQAPHDR